MQRFKTRNQGDPSFYRGSLREVDRYGKYATGHRDLHGLLNYGLLDDTWPT
jgi:hypothetical protein